jgi:GNAT superfamily N-acetyltransferase
MHEIRFSDRSEDIDIVTLSQWWMHGRTEELTERIVRHSMNFAAIDETSGELVGYGRAVTDYATFAWLTDVVVSRSRRGRGIGTALVAFACERLDAFGVKRIALATREAHGLYSRFGFEVLASPEHWMVRTR